MTVRVPAERESAGLVAQLLACALALRGWDQGPSALVLAAVGEAVESTVEHGAPPAGRVEVAIVAGTGETVVAVRTEGRRAALPSAEPHRVRFRGIFLAGRIAELVEVSANGPGSGVVLRAVRRPDGG